ncbi:T-cell immunoglobulin and mucin domain-containing protein 4-like [Centropristis striata]|uniref:T-cell immunoglobulin and mucin domain-containing protein 4-like n=1 Tax=Centropristis striata TaxID=184440 RepID=UPI0027E1945A|nr:T-cell immunoglobulin and mucin domain-containing protein 4-like [Centropristis striata]
MTLILLLALITVSESDGRSVVGRTGEDVTLPCQYDIRQYNALSVCWGRGQLPSSGCNNLLISTDGYKVKEDARFSSKYQLLGRLDKGDVSLTILNVSETDAGRYGCRVDIPGWFNDDKHHYDLKVERGQVASTELPQTSSSSSSITAENSSFNVVLVCVLFGLVALVMTGTIIIIVRKRQLKNPQQQQVNSTVRFSTTSSNLHLQSRGSAVENIYQIDGGVDGSEYEYCP